MPRIKRKSQREGRRSYADEFKQEAVQMLLDGHSAPSVAERLGLSGTNILYRWKRKAIGHGGPAARTLDDRLGQVQAALRALETRGYVVRRIRGYANLDQARSQLATDALAEGFAEILWIDADMGSHADDVEKLRAQLADRRRDCP